MSVSTKDLQLSIFHYFSFNLHSTMNPSGGWRCTFIVMQQVHMVFVIHSNVPLHSRWQISYHQLATNQRPRDTSDIVHLAACMVQASLTGGQSLLPLVDNTNTTFLHSRFGWLVQQQVTIYKLRSTPPSILHCTKVKSARFHFPPAISTPIRERQYEQYRSIIISLSAVAVKEERVHTTLVKLVQDGSLILSYSSLHQMPKMLTA